jgi:hypothetical protein
MILIEERGNDMTDHAYSRLARRLAIAAAAIGLLQLLLFILARAMSAGFGPDALEPDAYGGVAVLMLAVSRAISTASLGGLTIYCRTQGYLERKGSAGRSSPFKMTVVFIAALLLISIVAEFSLVPYELPLIGALINSLAPAAGTTAKLIWSVHGLNLLAFIQVVVCCLLAFGVMLLITRNRRHPASAEDLLYPPHAARIAATALALAIYTVLAWEHRLLWPLVSVYLAYFEPGAAWWITLGSLLWPVVPAAIAYAGVRSYLARLQLARARPARAAAAGVCASLALLIIGTALVFTVIWTHSRLFESETSLQVFAIFVMALYLAALAPACRVFCHLFYRSVANTVAPGAGRQAATA